MKIIIESKYFKEFNSFPISIGRRDDNDLVINDPLVSRIHFTIFKNENQFYIADLKSMNGTLLNGLKINESLLLSNNDEVSIGTISLKIEF
jgi:pSer/pThr/pTyr-binding forkhead associated (FHA) protein